jgi:hypothetical protein
VVNSAGLVSASISAIFRAWVLDDEVCEKPICDDAAKRKNRIKIREAIVIFLGSEVRATLVFVG